MMLKKIRADYILILLGTLIASWGSLFRCQNFIGLDFDSQSFIYWDYLRTLDLIPYKDFFYPYGLLFYYKTDSFILNLIVIVLLFIIFFSIYRIITSFTKLKCLSYSIFILYSLFIYLFIDLNTFVRYGLIFPYIYFLSKLSSEKVLFKTNNSFSIGLSLGLLFSFVNDLFFYAFIIYFAFVIYNLFTKSFVKNINYFRYAISIFSGFALGASFLLLFLIINDSIKPFIDNYKLLLEVANFAKVPFPPSLKIFENSFNIGIILVTIIYLLKINKNDKKFYLISSILLIILLIEQKNIVRSIYYVVSIFGVLLLFIYLIEIYKLNIKNKISRSFSFAYLASFIFLFGVIIYLEHNTFGNHTKVFDSINNYCYENKINNLPETSLKPYSEVKNKIDGRSVFSYPGDPVFYILFKQKPPPYPSVYESTPEFAQDKQIKYIKENKIDFIIINTTSGAIQDGVPDKLRNKKLYDFIMDNFSFYDQIGKFRLLKRN